MIRALLYVAAVLVAWCGWTLGLFPALDRLAPRDVARATVEPQNVSVQHKDRPNLRRCYFDLVSWDEDSFCLAWGGYALVWREACAEQPACYERFILDQQRCIDQPASCFDYLKARP